MLCSYVRKTAKLVEIFSISQSCLSVTLPFINHNSEYLASGCRERQLGELPFHNSTGRAPPLESYAGHIALHFLIFPHDFRIYSIRHPACILWDIIETEGKDGFLREHSFLYEAFPAAVRFGGSEDHNIGGFYMIIILNLISNRPTRSSELRCTLNVLGLLLLWGPSILSYPTTKFNPELYTIAMTAQQYGCLGWLDDDRKPGYESPDIARAFLTCYT